ncbi:MAG TPA: T9SS type A sorting domain-containing protein [Ferruginibacter sp.]|nr:T9SS type A sorting domain-containing protein [Ferruginibacter sp.]HMP19491.1 T9SS type A sorting domain-containing protein [Ferruginibacter sp.]
MNKLYPQRFLRASVLTLVFIYLPVFVFAQTVQITANPGQSGNIVIGPNNYHVSENIYTDEEIGSSNFTTVASAINHIDFNVFTIGANSSVGNYNIYLKEVPAGTETFTVGAYSLNGYTLVFSGTYVADVVGWVGVDLTTSFVRTSGSNLQLLIERLDNTPHAGFQFRATNGNNNGSSLLTSRRLNTATAPIPGTTVLNTASSFRPQVQLRHINANDAALTQLYTLGELPIPFATPHTISANIINNGGQAINNLDVTLTISGANAFNDVQTITSLAPGASATVSFAAFTPAVTGTNTVSVTLPDDDFNGDNNITISQQITVNAYNYAYSPTPSGYVGVVSNTGDFVAKFFCNGAASVNQVGVYFNSTGQPFKIGIWGDNGGLPGSLLWESEPQVTAPGLFTLPVSPAVPVSGNFYVGAMQTGTANLQFAYQNETPIRPATFFSAVPSGSGNWTDFSPGNPFKFMIEPRLTITNDVGVSTINTPLSGKSLDNCGIVPQATISNYGSNDQLTAFDATFIIKRAGNIVYTDTKAVSLSSGESKEISFTPFSGSESGSDSSFCFTSLATDGATNNDTLVNAFTTGNYSYGEGVTNNGLYPFGNSTSCADPSPYKATYNWITETSNEINWGGNGDDNVTGTPITLPFSYKFFGIDYTQLWVSTNGWISFSDPGSLTAPVVHTPVLIPSAGGINNYIAGLLTNLDVTNSTYPDAHVYYGGDASQFVITYHHAHLKNSPVYISFQIILKPQNNANGEVIIQYNDAESTSPIPSALLNNGTVGLEDATGANGILYRYNGSFGPLFGSPLALRFKPPTAQPVTLLSFTAARRSGINTLTWVTSQELNSSYFAVERSTDGRNFITVGTVSAAGNSTNNNSYSFSDNPAPKGMIYYRLKLVDTDNSYTYSAVKMIKNTGFADVTVFPNPGKDAAHINITADKRSTATITISDQSGRLLYNQHTALNEGLNRININTANFATGTYLIKIQLNEEVIVRRFNRL